MLPYEPEPMADLQARYKTALAFQYEVDEVVAGQVPQPEDCREQVFDTEEGYRITVSIGIYPNGAWQLNVSAGLAMNLSGSGHYLSRAGLDLLAEQGLAKFRDISGDSGPLEYAGECGPDIWPTWTRHLAGERPSDDQVRGWFVRWAGLVAKQVEAIKQ